MLLSQYCKENNYTLQQYENLQENIKQIAHEIRSTLHYKGGMYFETKELFKNNDFILDDDIKAFVIQELKKLDIEFYDNNKLYRVCD